MVAEHNFDGANFDVDDSALSTCKVECQLESGPKAISSAAGISAEFHFSECCLYESDMTYMHA